MTSRIPALLSWAEAAHRRGKQPRTLTDDQWDYAKSDGDIFRAIERGPGSGAAECNAEIERARWANHERLVRGSNGSQASMNGGVTGLPSEEEAGEISTDRVRRPARGSKWERECQFGWIRSYG